MKPAAVGIIGGVIGAVAGLSISAGVASFSTTNNTLTMHTGKQAAVTCPAPLTWSQVSASTGRLTCTTATVAVGLGQSIQAAVDAHLAGTTFALAAGTFRSQSIAPKSGDTFVGDPAGTVLSGAHVLTGWTQNGPTWTVGQQSTNFAFYGQCMQVLCDQPEQLFVDHVLVTPVSSAAAVTPSTWFFDHRANTITVGADPTGHLVETSDTQRAFEAIADKVTIKNLTVEMYATDNQNGAIQAGPRPGGWADGGNNWLLENLTVEWNHGVGIAMGGATVLRNVKADFNGNLGVSGTGCLISCPTGTISGGGLVDGGEISGNNTTGVDAGWSAGGGKWAGGYNNLVVQNVSVLSNQGPGLWADESDVNTQFLNNAVSENRDAGIFVEISYGAKVTGNVVTGNGWLNPGWLWQAGILVAASSDVEVSANTVAGNGNAIAGVEQNRGSGTLGPHVLTGLNVHDNVINLDPGNSGVVEDNGDLRVFSANHFAHNTFTSTGSSFRYAWNNSWLDGAGWAATGQS